MSWYARQGALTPETSIFARHDAAFVGTRVLDIAIGAGRTTRFLAPIASSYLGIDLSKPMVEAARRSFPDRRRGSFRQYPTLAPTVNPLRALERVARWMRKKSNFDLTRGEFRDEDESGNDTLHGVSRKSGAA